MPQKNNKPVFLFFVAAIAIILIAMTVSRKRSSLAYELSFPMNNGVAELSSNGDSITAACQDGKFFVWQWVNLLKSPQVLQLDCDQALMTKTGLAVSIKRLRPNNIIVTDINSKKAPLNISLHSNINRALMTATRDKSTIAVSLAHSSENDDKEIYQLAIVEPNSGTIKTVTEIKPESITRLFKLAIADNASVALMTGEKGKKGWLVLIDIKTGKILWEKQEPEIERFHSGAFSPDGSIIYARGSDGNVWKIETLSGKITGHLKLPFENKKSTVGQSSLQEVAVSPDGRIVASVVFKMLYMWDAKTGKLIFKVSPGHKIESGLIFSMDGRFAATSALRQGGKIKIWRCPVLK